MSAAFSDVTPNSSAWIVAKIAQFTASAQRLSPSSTAGASGSFENTSSRITSESGPPSASGKFARTALSWLVSDDQPSHEPAIHASWSRPMSSNDSTLTVRPRAANSVATLPSVVVPATTQTMAPSMSSIDA